VKGQIAAAASVLPLNNHLASRSTVPAGRSRPTSPVVEHLAADDGHIDARILHAIRIDRQECCAETIPVQVVNVAALEGVGALRLPILRSGHRCGGRATRHHAAHDQRAFERVRADRGAVSPASVLDIADGHSRKSECSTASCASTARAARRPRVAQRGRRPGMFPDQSHLSRVRGRAAGSQAARCLEGGRVNPRTAPSGGIL
jgi:hypothetical protein